MSNETLHGSELRGFELFENLGDDELSLIAKETVRRAYAAGGIVCEEDSASDSMFLIKSGKVDIIKQGVSLAELGPGDYFGEMSLITGAPRNATVTTLEPSVLLEISAPVFHVIIERSPQATRNLLMTFDSRLRRHNEKVVWQYRKLKEQYEELENSHQRLLLSDKMASVGLLTAGIAHEINNPLFVITGYLDVIRSMLDDGAVSADELGEIVAKLETASRSIVKLVSGIKTYVRIEDAAPAPIDLNSAIQESLDLVSFLYRRDQIELEIDFAHGHPVILGNIARLQQVLMNLLSNARDAMESSAAKIITVRTREADGEVVLEISDTGCGIPPDRLERVFSRGYTTKPVGKGSGMGLNLVRQMIREMRGEIGVESEPGHGTTFRVVFPRHAV
jgi:signal transduction histidine kinase